MKIFIRYDVYTSPLILIRNCICCLFTCIYFNRDFIDACLLSSLASESIVNRGNEVNNTASYTKKYKCERKIEDHRTEDEKNKKKILVRSGEGKRIRESIGKKEREKTIE